MSRIRLSRISCCILFSLALPLAGVRALTQEKQTWRDAFLVDKANLVDRGKGTYFNLEPGYCLHFAHGKDTLTITVLDETQFVDGVKTRVVEEREMKGGKLAEVSRNYFAIDPSNDALYYFGEDVDIYKNGKVAGHEGAWRAGLQGASFGLMVSGKARVGDKYYQELAPKVAMDRAEVISVTEEVRTPAGTFNNCLQTRESSAVERGSERKWYAPGVGLVRDAEFVLVRIDKDKT